METLNQSLQNVLVSYGSNASQEMKGKITCELIPVNEYTI